MPLTLTVLLPAFLSLNTAVAALNVRLSPFTMPVYAALPVSSVASAVPS